MNMLEKTLNLYKEVPLIRLDKSEITFKELIKEFKNNDLSNFNTFFELTKKSVFYNILSFVNYYELAEDLLQDTYVKFLLNINEIKINKSIMGYLITISKNISLDYLKKKKEILGHEDELFISVHESHSDEIDKSILLNKISKLVKPKEYELLLLHIYNDLTFDEISKLISEPLGTVLYRYNKTIKYLKEVLEDEKE